MDFFKKIIDIDKDKANEVDVESLSTGDLEQMFLVKTEQLKAMTLQYEELRGHHQNIQMELDALRRKLGSVTKQQKRQRELDSQVIMQLRSEGGQAGGDNDAYIVSLQQRVEQLSENVASLQHDNSILQSKVDNLTAENHAIEERKKQEADAYERKVMSWKKAVKEIHDKDQLLLAELQAKLAEGRAESPGHSAKELSDRIKELELEVSDQKAVVQESKLELDAVSDKYVTALNTIKELEARLYSPKEEEANLEAEGGNGKPTNAALKELEADCKRLYERSLEADATIAALQKELAKVLEDKKKELEALQTGMQTGQTSSASDAEQLKVAALQCRIDELEAAIVDLQGTLRHESMAKDELQRQSLEERKKLQKEAEAMSWESIRLEKEIARLNDFLAKKQREVEDLHRNLQSAQEDAGRSQREALRELQRKLEEATEQRETEVAQLNEQLQAKQAELDILNFKMQASPEVTHSGAPSRSFTIASQGLQGTEQLLAKLQLLQEEAKFREQAVEQFCQEAQESQVQLRDAEDRIQNLSAELMTRDMELEAKDRALLSIREKSERLVEEHTKLQEVYEQCKQEAEQQLEDLQQTVATLDASLKAKEQEMKEVIQELGDQKRETGKLQQQVDDLLEEQRQGSRRLRDAHLAIKQLEGKKTEGAEAKKAQLVDSLLNATAAARVPAQTISGNSASTLPSSMDRFQRLPPALRPAVNSASGLIAKYGPWRVAKYGMAFIMILGTLLVFSSLLSTGKPQFMDTPEMLELRSSLASTHAQLSNCLQELNAAPSKGAH